MKKFIFVTLAMIPLMVNAAQSLDELKALQPQMCQDINQEDGYYGDMECARRLLEDSEGKLKARLVEIGSELKRINHAPYQKAFKLDQTSWEAYRKNRCAYVTSGIDKNSNNHQYRFALCEASENYKRLETLKEEPSFS